MNRCIVLLALAFGASAQQPKPLSGPLPVPTKSEWPEEPDGFKQFKFGSTAAELRESITFSECWLGVNGVSNCLTQLSIGDYPARCIFGFPADHLSMIVGFFNSDNFQTFRMLFVERYGKPHGQNLESVQNGFGAKFENVQLFWKGKRASVTLSHYSEDTKTGTFVVVLNSYQQELDKQKEEKAKKAAKEL